jgi:hypothetical protein
MRPLYSQETNGAGETNRSRRRFRGVDRHGPRSTPSASGRRGRRGRGSHRGGDAVCPVRILTPIFERAGVTAGGHGRSRRQACYTAKPRSDRIGGLATANPPLKFELIDVYAGVNTVAIHYRNVGHKIHRRGDRVQAQASPAPREARRPKKVSTDELWRQLIVRPVNRY